MCICNVTEPEEVAAEVYPSLHKLNEQQLPFWLQYLLFKCCNFTAFLLFIFAVQQNQKRLQQKFFPSLHKVSEQQLPPPIIEEEEGQTMPHERRRLLFPGETFSIIIVCYCILC